MRTLRKVWLLLVGVMAGMAFVPSAASAQNVELEREQGGNCPTLIFNVGHVPSETGCAMHVVTEQGTTMDLYQHVAGVGEVPFSQCSNEFDATFNVGGDGFIYNQALTPEGGPCGREVCDEGEGTANPHRNIDQSAEIYESFDGSGERMELTFCVYAHNSTRASEGTLGFLCTLDLAVSRVGHAYEIRTLPISPAFNQHGSPCLNVGGAIEVVGHWVSTPATPEHRGFMVHH